MGANTPIEPMATPRPAALLLVVLAVELVFEALEVPALLPLGEDPALLTLFPAPPATVPVGTPLGALVPVAPLIWACSVELNVPDIWSRVNLAEKLSAKKVGFVGSCSVSLVKRMK